MAVVIVKQKRLQPPEKNPMISLTEVINTDEKMVISALHQSGKISKR